MTIFFASYYFEHIFLNKNVSIHIILNTFFLKQKRFYKYNLYKFS